MRAILGLALAAGIVSSAPAAELTSDQVRVLLGSVGVNPGTTKQVGALGIYTLHSVRVRGGQGWYTLRLHITERK